MLSNSIQLPPSQCSHLCNFIYQLNKDALHANPWHNSLYSSFRRNLPSCSISQNEAFSTMLMWKTINEDKTVHFTIDEVSSWSHLAEVKLAEAQNRKGTESCPHSRHPVSVHILWCRWRQCVPHLVCWLGEFVPLDSILALSLFPLPPSPFHSPSYNDSNVLRIFSLD